MAPAPGMKGRTLYFDLFVQSPAKNLGGGAGGGEGSKENLRVGGLKFS